MGYMIAVTQKTEEKANAEREQAIQPIQQKLTLAKKFNMCNPDPTSWKEIDSTIGLANSLIEQTNSLNISYGDARLNSAKRLSQNALDKAFFKADSSMKADLMRQLRQNDALNSKLNNKALGNRNKGNPQNKVVRAGPF